MNKDNTFLVVGLGNPGKKYLNTRHNIGSYVIDFYLRLLNLSIKSISKLESYIAIAKIGDKKVIFCQPTTYMNLSGSAVRKCIDYYNISLDNVLILTDDTYLPFGDVRLKLQGSAGGHNGLKDIEEKLSTNKYKRLRIGIGEKTTDDLADYVLQRFSEDEGSKLETIARKCIEEINEKFLEVLQENE